jgi:hypothetical protein
MGVKIFIFILSTCFSNIFIGQTIKTQITEKEKIEALISSIEDLKNAKFYRNGALYDATTAAKHLRMKYSKAGNKIKTASDFIEKIASKSSMTGQAYKIVFSDGKVIPARKYFYDKLKTL